MAVWIALFVTMQLQTGAQATLARAASLKDQGRMDEAIARYREFVQSDPDDFEGQRQLGAALLEAGQAKEAVAPLRRAVELQPRSAAAHYSFGYDLLQLQQFAEAQDQFQQALALDADYATAQYALGMALWAGGKHEEAVQSFREGVRRWPTSAEAHYNLGAVLERSGQLDAAVDSYTKAADINQAYADANFALGLIHAKRGEQTLAIDRFKRVLQSKPDWPPAQIQLAWLLATSPNASISDHRAALPLAEQAATGTSDQDASALDVLAAALAANGQFDRAVKAAERTLVVLGSDADPRTVAAARDRLALYRLGKPYVATPQSQGRRETENGRGSGIDPADVR
jgi:tetratricopeptide (TPR) repeat protein